MKNKKLTIVIISIAILSIGLVALYKLYDNGAFYKSNDNKQIVANYKGGVVTLQQVEAELSKLILKNPKLKGLSFNNLNSDQKEMVVKEIVLKEIAYKEAKKQKLNKSDDYKQALKLFETEMLKQKLFLKLAEDAKATTNLKENYDKLVLELKDKEDLRIRYIALNTETEAMSVHKILTKYPKSFANQAKKKSIDKDTALKGGDLGFVLEDVLPVEIVSQAKKLPKDKISKPFKLTDKWVIIKLEDRRQAEVAKFEDTKEALAASLARKAIQDFIADSIKKAGISITVR